MRRMRAAGSPYWLGPLPPLFQQSRRFLRSSDLWSRLSIINPYRMHHTALSLFTATADYAPYLAAAGVREAVSEVAAATPPFSIGVRGVTLLICRAMPAIDEVKTSEVFDM